MCACVPVCLSACVCVLIFSVGVDTGTNAGGGEIVSLE